MFDKTNNKSEKDCALSTEKKENSCFKHKWHAPELSILYMENTSAGGIGYTDGSTFSYS